MVLLLLFYQVEFVIVAVVTGVVADVLLVLSMSKLLASAYFVTFS